MRALYITTAALLLLVAAGLWFFRPATPTVADVASSTQDGVTPAVGFAAATQDSGIVGGPPKPPRTPPAGFTEYRNNVYGFSLFYPDTLAVKTYSEAGGAATITFQNANTVEGFQIFVAPYSERQVSAARFKQDEPSSVMQGLQNVTIDGAPATSFYSTNLALGDTAEVWFIHGGFLYEVTSLKSLTAWFAGIMQTWQFL